LDCYLKLKFFTKTLNQELEMDETKEMNQKEERQRCLDRWLVEAVSRGSLEFTELFLEKGANPNLSRPDGKTLLMIAAGLKDQVSCKMVNLFIAKGVDVNARDAEEKTAFMYAVLADNIKVMHTLWTSKADINAVDDDGSSALLLAFHQKKETIELLVSQGADVSVKDKHGQNILMLSASIGTLETCEFFLSKGCDPYDKDNKGQNALMIAVGSKNIKAVEFFISIKMDLDTVNNSGETPLMKAAEIGDLELCALLVDHGANVNAKNNYGKTALIAAAFKDNPAVVDFFLHKKAYHHVMCDDGFTALAIAKCGKRKETIKVLKKFGVKK